ncbi:thioredoxin family protein [uncultured Brevundimonas sp.]|uniref:protein-disulfide reductase DsbD family protein n=1 Tax=uncultured Brevundimonas sp. TaxID=213418 RepID=UPI002622FDC8|nr:thioredoxin family protein [uncultured Brevundimonas sp.]
MIQSLRFLAIILIGLVLTMGLQARAASTGPKVDSRITAELVPMSQWVVPGSTAIVAVRQDISEGWHTYWRNPGDSGGATEIVWTLPEGVKAGDILWPVPQRKSLMGLMSYVYSGVAYLPVAVEIPSGLAAGDTFRAVANVRFLVCSDQMCVPVDMELATDLKVGTGAPPLNPRFGQDIQQALLDVPQPSEIQATASLKDGQLILSAAGGALATSKPQWAYFYPFEGRVLDHAAPQRVERGEKGLRFTAPTGRQTRNGVEGAVSGIIATDLGSWEVTALPAEPLGGTSGTLIASEPSDASQGAGFMKAALFALLGGLILNLMPCVFPVLAMKAAALSRSAHDPVALRRDGLAFTAGVLLSFLLLAGSLLALRAAGQGIGWGYQLQSPAVIAALSLLMLAVALNLSGVFDFGGALQRLGGHGRDGVFGAFMTGVLAVVVAAPCTAPFMAVAVGAALVLPWPLALTVFLMLGLGLALPYLVISLMPQVSRAMPRPGPWMERLRNILALPMYGTALWLGWVYSRQTGNQLLFLILAAGLLAVALAAYGFAARRGKGGAVKVVAVIVALIACVSAVMAMRVPVAALSTRTETALPSRPWSKAAVDAALAEGRPVLVNFTADWCVTCKINERTALSSERVASALADSRTVYLVGDWTRSDATITAELQRHGRSGVPLYLIYTPGQAEPKVLPQVLSEGLVVRAVSEAGSASR